MNQSAESTSDADHPNRTFWSAYPEGRCSESRFDPTAIARANSVVQGLIDAIEEYEEKAAKAESSGNSAKAKDLREAAAARKVWLDEAQKGLADFKKN